MELYDIIHKLNNNVKLTSAEDIKYEYVLPILQCLGYDIFNTGEVKPVTGTWDGDYMDYIIRLNGKSVFSVVVTTDIDDVDFDSLKRYWALNDGTIMTLVTDGDTYKMYVKTFAEELKPTRKIKLSKADSNALEQFKQYSKGSLSSGKGLGSIKETTAKEYVSLITKWAKGEREVPKFLTRFIIQMAGLDDTDETHNNIRKMFKDEMGNVSDTSKNRNHIVLDDKSSIVGNSDKPDTNTFTSGTRENTDIVKRTDEIAGTTSKNSVVTSGNKKKGSGLGRTPSLETWYGIETYQTEFAKRVHLEKFGGKTTGTGDSYEEKSTETIENNTKSAGIKDVPVVKKEDKPKKVNKLAKKGEETVEEVLARAASKRGLEKDTVIDESKLVSVGDAPSISNVPHINAIDKMRITMNKEINHSRVIANADMYNNGKCILQGGAKIVKEVNMDDKDAVALRNKYKESMVGDTLLEDIEFNGLRDATAFVCGFYDYKFAEWQDEKGNIVEVEEMGGIE